MKYILLFTLILFLSGCVSTTFKPSVDRSSVGYGLSEDQFTSQYGNIGQKVNYLDGEQDSFAWILDTGKERIWLSGNAFFGGYTTNRYHMVVVGFDEGKISSVNAVHADGNDKKVMPANRYTQIFRLGESLDGCKSNMSNQKRGQYGYILSEVVDSWIYSQEVFLLLQEYNRNNGNPLTPKTKSECDDAAAYIERAGYEMAQIKAEENKPQININNTNQLKNIINLW